MALVVLCTSTSALAQVACPGDVDFDRTITTADAVAAAELIFHDDTADIAVLERADANHDELITAADVLAIMLGVGTNCPDFLTPTRTLTATPTATASRAPTITPTPRATATPTIPCVVGDLPMGASSGALTEADCRRLFRNQARITDEYDVRGAVGSALKISVTATGGTTFTPYIRVTDANGYFGISDGRSPVEFVVTTTEPYRVLITSEPNTNPQTGSYNVVVASRTCPVATLQAGVSGSLQPSDCPAIFSPSRGNSQEPADTFTFDVTQPFTLINIRMRQSNEDSLLDPLLTVIGPNGHEVFPSFQGDDASPTGFGFDAQARFLATQTGRYTVIATGAGCEVDEEEKCNYTIIFRSEACSATAITGIPSDGRKSIAGVHYGDQSKTPCAAPLPVLGRTASDEPEVSSPADLYTFQATAGEAVTLELQSEAEAALFVYGPSTAGYPLMGVDIVSASNDIAQVGFGVPITGTYTVVASLQSQLTPPDPTDSTDPGDSAAYTLFAQKCPSRGTLNPGTPINSQFQALDCVSNGDVPLRTYLLNGSANQSMSIKLDTGAVQARVSLTGLDGVRQDSTVDPFDPNSPAARVTRILPGNGTYLVEASLQAGTPFNPANPPSFNLSASACATRVLSPPSISDSFASGDCDLGGGRRYDAYRLATTGTPVAVSLSAPANGCILALLSDGSVFPRATCSQAPLEFPIAGSGNYGLIVAANSAATTGAYDVRFRSCSLANASYGQHVEGTLTALDCVDQASVPSDWVLFSGADTLVQYNDGVDGTFTADFNAAATLLLTSGAEPLTAPFSSTAEQFFPLGSQLGVMAKISPSGGGALGNYQLQFGSGTRID